MKLVFLTTIFISLVILSGCKSKTKTEGAENKIMTHEQIVQRGDYLVIRLKCHCQRLIKMFCKKDGCFSQPI